MALENTIYTTPPDAAQAAGPVGPEYCDCDCGDDIEVDIEVEVEVDVAQHIEGDRRSFFA